MAFCEHVLRADPALVGVSDQTPQALIEQADRAMYQRKQSRARV